MVGVSAFMQQLFERDNGNCLRFASDIGFRGDLVYFCHEFLFGFMGGNVIESLFASKGCLRLFNVAVSFFVAA